MGKTTLFDELSANLDTGGKEALAVAMKYRPLSVAAAHWDNLTSDEQDKVGEAIGLSVRDPASDKGRSIGLDEYLWDCYERSRDIEGALQWIGDT